MPADWICYSDWYVLTTRFLSTFFQLAMRWWCSGAFGALLVLLKIVGCKTECGVPGLLTGSSRAWISRSLAESYGDSTAPMLRNSSVATSEGMRFCRSVNIMACFFAAADPWLYRKDSPLLSIKRACLGGDRKLP